MKRLITILILIGFLFTLSIPSFAQYETITLYGQINFKLYDKDGNLKDSRIVNNLVVTAGKNYLAAWLAAASQAGEFMTYLAVGTDSTAAAAGQTALIAETGTRVDGTLTSSTNVWQNQGTFAAGNGTGALKEAGVFSASSGGTMLCRQVFDVINKSAADSLSITWQLTLAINDNGINKFLCFNGEQWIK